MFCFRCDAEIPESSAFCSKCGWQVASLKPQGSLSGAPQPPKGTAASSPEKIPESRQNFQAGQFAPTPARQGPVKCPQCGSSQVHAEKRGWNAWTGFLGSGKIVLTCLTCAKTFRPGEGA